MDTTTEHLLSLDDSHSRLGLLRTRCLSANHALFHVCREIRVKIFVNEQGFDLKDEFDEVDKCAIHVLFSILSNDSREEEEFIGVLRYDPNKRKIGRIALKKKYRGVGIGKKMMQSFERTLVNGHDELSKVEGDSSSAGLPLTMSDHLQLRLHSQIQAIGFYSNLGYRPVGEIFLEDGAPHQLMVKEITLASKT